ncbi:hypothetical protein [Noviherbaspirillum pedocola]|uniref:Uncharacterized protein n=1 Tax=Noviherbaspirillum pedocola TaxID=2801341 RepID=A0A934W763_9BURK|nr:hypothetical protein [Noviherbaspirillum pedocola]MBK4735178.1 hypothetical protein [Noviherbaspirillum pedocola]
MANETTISAANAAIKWTDGEWSRIAAWLLEQKGNALLASDTLEEIKAKDVFLAQEVLPAERHRKQISIAQGFQGIRARLRIIFRQMRLDQTLAGKPEPAEQPEQPEQMRAAVADPVAQQATREARPDAQAAERETLDGLIERARPIVALICDELARVLVDAWSRPGGAARFAPLLAPLTQAVSAQAQTRIEPAAELPGASQAFTVASQPDADEAETGPLGDMQPLFDPKLPPSANSDFKPVIGLVASRAGDYADLQALYPQLRLSIVPADAVRSPEVFRNCQRIIGLRNEMPQATDDLLRRALNYRYVRLHGGAGQVREQLNAWLDNPATMSATGAVRHDKRQGNDKRRSKWPPRVER